MHQHIGGDVRVSVELCVESNAHNNNKLIVSIGRMLVSLLLA